ncbi:MAG: hypothetical protein LBS31_05835 [Candidatus Adiutrix sp.]|jgi:hypothetical protein|nr:hypothetical protein [Candidatus Adiutrix sp.]
MRSILIDELLAAEVEAVIAYLDTHAERASLERLYWIKLEPELWGEAQRQAWGNADAAPVYRLAVEVGTDWARFELLVRSENLRNIGGGQADEAQTLFMLRWIEAMAAELNLASCRCAAPAARPPAAPSLSGG